MIFLLVSLKKNILSQKFQELLKKLFCLGLVMFCFFYINLNYSVITLPSHYSTKNIFMFLCAKTTLFTFKQEGLCFQALSMCILALAKWWLKSYMLKPTWRNIILAGKNLLFAKARTPSWKISSLTGTG